MSAPWVSAKSRFYPATESLSGKASLGILYWPIRPAAFIRASVIVRVWGIVARIRLRPQNVGEITMGSLRLPGPTSVCLRSWHDEHWHRAVLIGGVVGTILVILAPGCSGKPTDGRPAETGGNRQPSVDSTSAGPAPVAGNMPPNSTPRPESAGPTANQTSPNTPAANKQSAAPGVPGPADPPLTEFDRLKKAIVANEVTVIDELAKIGRRSPGQDQDAELLSKLLPLFKPVATRSDRPAVTGIGGPGSSFGGGANSAPGFGTPSDNYEVKEQILEAILEAIEANGSKFALKTLEDLVRGEIDVGLHANSAASVAFQTLVRQWSTGVEDFIVTILANPQGVFTKKQPQNIIDGITAECEDSLTKYASPRARTALAQHLLTSQLTDASRMSITRVVFADHEANTAAQALLYGSPQFDASNKSALQFQLLLRGVQAFGELLDVQNQFAVDITNRLTNYAGSAGNLPTMPAAGMQPMSRPRRMSGPFGGLGATPPTGIQSMSGPRRTPGREGSSPATPAKSMSSPAEQRARPVRIAQALWTAGFSENIALALAPLPVTDRLAFLSVLPTRAARASILETLEKDWMQGPGLFSAEVDSGPIDGAILRGAPDRMESASDLDESATAVRRSKSFGRDWLDPGLLLVVKSLPRAEPSEKPATSSKTKSPARSGVQKPLTGAQKREIEMRAKMAPKYAWLDATSQFVEVLTERFRTAAKVRLARDAANLDGSSATGNPDSLKTEQSPKPPVVPAADKLPDASLASMPVKLHHGATVIADYHTVWPADLESRMPDAKAEPFAVHFVRCESQTTLARLTDHYSKQFSDPSVFQTRRYKNGRWIDAVQPGSDPRLIRSIDIRISTLDETSASGREPKDERFIVEILIVEISKLHGHAK